MTTARNIRDLLPNDVAVPTVSVIVPALNEARNLPYVAERMPADVTEIVFVDGGSQDDTVAVAKQLWPDAVHLRQTRAGKGNALACGFAAATGDIIVAIDADGSTDPAEIPRFVGALLSGADFAKGTRFVNGGGSQDITRIRRAGNWGLNSLVNLLFSTDYTDLCYGYNAFWRHCLDSLDLPSTATTLPQWGDGFEIETLINVRVAARGLTISEVHSFESDRIHGVSNLNAVRDGLRVLRTICGEYRTHRKSARPRITSESTVASLLEMPAPIYDVIPSGTLLSRRLRKHGVTGAAVSVDDWQEEKAL
jgi:glycosyltransferase involved in cell wall biosynthesis